MRPSAGLQRLTKSWRKRKNKKMVIVRVSFSALSSCFYLPSCRPSCCEEPDGFTLLVASSTPTSTLTWISWFCSLPGHEYFCEVTEDFIEDDFNLTGLNTMVPFWKEAMEMVLDVEPGVGSPLILTCWAALTYFRA